MEYFFCRKCAGAFRRYIPRWELETFKAEVQEERARQREKAKVAAGNGNVGNPAKAAQDEKEVREAQAGLAGDPMV